MKLSMRRGLGLVIGLVVAFLVGCAGLSPPPPATFNQRLAYADGLTQVIGDTCLDLSKRDRIPISIMVRCTKTVEQAGTMIDSARSLGSATGEDGLAAAQKLLLDLEADLKEREKRS